MSITTYIHLPDWISGGDIRITEDHVEYREPNQSQWWEIGLLEGAVRMEEGNSSELGAGAELRTRGETTS